MLLDLSAPNVQKCSYHCKILTDRKDVLYIQAQYAISEFPKLLLFKTRLSANPSYENEFYLHENKISFSEWFRT